MFKNNSPDTKDIVRAAVIAALYAVLGIMFAPIGFGPVQFRVAEALCMLVVFSPSAVWGITVGCAITNLYGAVTFASILGPTDILVGTLATFVAAVIGYKLREVRTFGLPVASALPAVVINALAIGAELTVAVPGRFSFGLFATQAALVGLGQIAAAGVLGCLLVRTIENMGLAPVLFGRAAEEKA